MHPPGSGGGSGSGTVCRQRQRQRHCLLAIFPGLAIGIAAHCCARRRQAIADRHGSLIATPAALLARSAAPLAGHTRCSVTHAPTLPWHRTERGTLDPLSRGSSVGFPTGLSKKPHGCLNWSLMVSVSRENGNCARFSDLVIGFYMVACIQSLVAEKWALKLGQGDPPSQNGAFAWEECGARNVKQNNNRARTFFWGQSAILPPNQFWGQSAILSPNQFWGPGSSKVRSQPVKPCSARASDTRSRTRTTCEALLYVAWVMRRHCALATGL